MKGSKIRKPLLFVLLELEREPNNEQLVLKVIYVVVSEGQPQVKKKWQGHLEVAGQQVRWCEPVRPH